MYKTTDEEGSLIRFVKFDSDANILQVVQLCVP